MQIVQNSARILNIIAGASVIIYALFKLGKYFLKTYKNLKKYYYGHMGRFISNFPSNVKKIIII